MESIDRVGKRIRYRFIEIAKQELKRKTNYTLDTNEKLNDNVYAWEVLSADKDGQTAAFKELTTFAVGQTRGDVTFLLGLHEEEEECTDIVPFTSGEGDAPSEKRNDSKGKGDDSGGKGDDSGGIDVYDNCKVIHTVNLKAADFMSTDFIDTTDGEVNNPCIPTNSSTISAQLSFSIQIPCAAVEAAEGDKIEVYVYKKKSLDESAELEVYINGQEEGNLRESLILFSSDFNPGCVDDPDPCCEVDVFVESTFDVERDAADKLTSHHVVFFLKDSGTHAHSQRGQSDGILLPDKHVHRGLAKDNCAQQYATESLDYFICLEETPSYHLSQHTVVLEILPCMN